MAPSDVTKFLIPKSSTTTVQGQVSLNQEPPTIQEPLQPRSKLSLNRKKRALPDLISQFDLSFDAEVKRARLSLSSASLKGGSASQVNSDNMNGHKSIDSRSASGASGKSQKSPPVASLCNLGNTCFLNSVLYTLRFTPGFLHNLHHMVYDLGLNGSGSKGTKRINGITTHQVHTNGSTNGIADAETELIHDFIEQLHDVFRVLSSSDESDSREPLPPSNFLTAVGKLNPLFEGNQQQDAHELLGTILNLLQDIKIPANSCATNSEMNDENRNGNLPEKPESDKKSKKKSAKSTFYAPSNNSVTSNVTQNGTSAKVTPPVKPDATLPNFVKENFVGKSLMGTKCLECETSTYRSETFTNIDIPLTFSPEEEGSSTTDLFMNQIMASETLRENNKYWCAECSRLNEAQRSVQYETSPRILLLQLKRFTATGNRNYTSKINDYIPTPMSMSCFCKKCLSSKEDAKHHYRLYAVIMHLGATLASGHYIAYVRATDTSDYLHCQRNSTVERKNKRGILKYFSRNSDNGRGPMGGGSSMSHTGQPNGASSTGSISETSICRSFHCCGIRTANQLCSDLPQNGVSVLLNNHKGVELKQEPDVLANGGNHSLKNGSIGSTASLTSEPEEVWLECDDDNISVITRRQFEEELSSKHSSTTPYLLFYQRISVPQ